MYISSSVNPDVSRVIQLIWPTARCKPSRPARVTRHAWWDGFKETDRWFLASNCRANSAPIPCNSGKLYGFTRQAREPSSDEDWWLEEVSHPSDEKYFANTLNECRIGAITWMFSDAARHLSQFFFFWFRYTEWCTSWSPVRDGCRQLRGNGFAYTLTYVPYRFSHYIAPHNTTVITGYNVGTCHWHYINDIQWHCISTPHINFHVFTPSLWHLCCDPLEGP